MRLTKFNEETGKYEYIEKAKTQEEFMAQRKAVIQRLGEIEDKQEVITNTENKSDNSADKSNEQIEPPKRLNYESFSSHDCEAWYSCPYCKKKIGSWSLPSSLAVAKGEKMYCPHCKKEVKYPIR